MESHPCEKNGGVGPPWGARKSSPRTWRSQSHQDLSSVTHTRITHRSRGCEMYAKPFRLRSYANSATKLFRMRSYKIIGLESL